MKGRTDNALKQTGNALKDRQTILAQWMISEAGLQSLTSAGITIGWLRAWVISAGATVVNVHLLNSNAWCDLHVDWQIFYATPDELKEVSEVKHGHKVLKIPIGDIAYRRYDWLATLNDMKPLLPLYVCAINTLSITLEAGLSGSLCKPKHDHYLNATGLLIEEQVIAILQQHQLFVRTVESCTAGSIAARLCRVPGASNVVDRAWVTYSNAAKQEEAGVTSQILDQYGAVSQEAVVCMAGGGSDASHICIAVSGIAGPAGGSKDKPVGTVWIAVAQAGQKTLSQCLQFAGARHEIQSRAAIAALHLLLKYVHKLRF